MAEFIAPSGPVDIAVVGFPERTPDDRVTAAVHDAVASGAVRVLDALVVSKDDDGALTVVDVEDAVDALDLLGFSADLPGFLAEGDALDVGAELPPGTSAVIIAWENVWAARLRLALHEAGGVIALHERIQPDDVAVAVQAVAVTQDA